MRSVTIVGASLAGMRAAETLRREGFDGTVTVVGDETEAPYDRPPLSKQVLAGEWEPERISLYDSEALADLRLEWRLGGRAVGFDAALRSVTLTDGERLAADGVVIATGARTRTLRGTEDLAGVYTLRTLADSLAIRSEFEATPQRIVVVGAGFIGAEVAATARGRGLEVTMVEMAETPLERVLGSQIGQVCAEVHADHGVDLRLGVGVDSITGTDRVEQVVLSDGTRLDADVVVVGVGVIPNTEWLEGSGLQIDNGVACDETCLAAPGVVAAGDVARWPNRLFGQSMRVEHWDNAIEQGMAAAKRLLAGEGAEPFAPVPWFWSDQYDRKIQLAGRSGPDDEVVVVTGSLEERRFAAVYGRAGRIVAVLGFNRPRHVMQYRRLIARGASWDEALEFARSQP
ncbi:MAG: FAD/NAD(P)-binding oxidoreductase [bacterium]|nr:FAD/NAD(P)-binding oxidoreductase [bacterium]